MSQVKPCEWDYGCQPDGEPFTDKDGNEVIGFHDRTDDQDADALLASFEAYEGRPLLLRPILVRWASEIECRINGWEEGTFVGCTTRAKNPMPMWQIEVAPDSNTREEAGETECFSCDEVNAEEKCPKSKRACGHHCNCSWVHDHCHWCDKEFGEEAGER